LLQAGNTADSASYAVYGALLARFRLRNRRYAAGKVAGSLFDRRIRIPRFGQQLVRAV
jgi:hypothetical protein